MWIDIVLLTVLAVCVATDLRSRKIYNKIIFPALAFAFIYHAAAGGWQGAADSVAGFTIGIAILLIPYMMGGMGAGDVKLLALVGALKGVWFVLETAVYMALFGALIALAVIFFKNGVRSRLREIGMLFLGLKHGILPKIRGHWSGGSYPYGVAIAGGAFICFLLEGWGAV